jgi:hypothetical protein
MGQITVFVVPANSPIPATESRVCRPLGKVPIDEFCHFLSFLSHFFCEILQIETIMTLVGLFLAIMVTTWLECLGVFVTVAFPHSVHFALSFDTIRSALTSMLENRINIY